MRFKKNVRMTLLYLAFVVIGVVMVFPFIWMIATSFKTGTDIYSLSLLPKKFTLDNYREVLAGSDFLIVVFNLAVCSGLLGVVPFQGLVKEFMIHRLDILPAVCYIQVGTLWIGILGVKPPAVMIDRASSHHDAYRPFQINPSFLFRRASGGPLLLSAKVTQKHF